MKQDEHLAELADEWERVWAAAITHLRASGIDPDGVEPSEALEALALAGDREAYHVAIQLETAVVGEDEARRAFSAPR